MQSPPAVQLAWSRGAGADSCIDAGELAAKVEATIGRPVSAGRPDSENAGPDAGPSAAPNEPNAGEGAPEPDGVHLVGRVQPLGSGWIAIVQARAGGPAFRREVTLDAPDCRQLDEAIVLVVALMAEAAVPAAPPMALPPRPVPAAVAIGPDVAAAVGMLPGVAVGFGLATEVALPPWWHLVAWAHAWPATEALESGGGARLAAWTFGVAPCVGVAPLQRLSVFGCLGASGGVIYTGGVGLDVPLSRSRPYLQGELRAGVRLRMAGPFFLRLELGVGAPIARDSYQFVDASGATHDVFQTSALVPLGRLGIEFRAP